MEHIFLVPSGSLQLESNALTKHCKLQDYSNENFNGCPRTYLCYLTVTNTYGIAGPRKHKNATSWMTSNIQYLLAKLFCWLFFKITKQPNKMIRLKTVQNLLQRSVESMLKKYSLKYNRFLPDTLKCSGLKWFRWMQVHWKLLLRIDALFGISCRVEVGRCFSDKCLKFLHIAQVCLYLQCTSRITYFCLVLSKCLLSK